MSVRCKFASILSDFPGVAVLTVHTLYIVISPVEIAKVHQHTLGYLVSRYKQCGWPASQPGCPTDTNFHIQPVSKSSVSLSDNRPGLSSGTRSPGLAGTCQDLPGPEREREDGRVGH